MLICLISGALRGTRRTGKGGGIDSVRWEL